MSVFIKLAGILPPACDGFPPSQWLRRPGQNGNEENEGLRKQRGIDGARVTLLGWPEYVALPLWFEDRTERG